MLPLDIGTVRGWLDALALALLAPALPAVLVRRLDRMIYLLAVQGVLLAAAAGVVALSTGTLHGYLAVAITIVAKVLVVPGILLFVLREVKLKQEVEAVIPPRVAILLALVLVL